ncbi:MAG: hypothetical protein RJQ09_16940 [Cyclobacteriaceae bacterium]
MERKYFEFDKNYLLREAQTASREYLLQSLIERVKEYYLAYHNPLGLVDDTIIKIKAASGFDVSDFEEFYNELAAVYRYKFGEVQLEFLWDGTSHFDKYRKEWKEGFFKWIEELCCYESFIKAVFELTVFRTQFTRPELAQTRLKNIISQHFDIKVYVYRGIVNRMSVA